MSDIEVGDEMIFHHLCPIRFPGEKKTKVTILGKSPHGSKKWYFRKPNGGSDSTCERFLSPLPKEGETDG